MRLTRIPKKRIVFVLVFVLIQMLFSIAYAEFDYGMFKENDAFSVSEYPNEQCAYVDVRGWLSVADSSFEHNFESPSYYSYIYNDLVVFDYDTPNAYPIWRVWIEYSGSKHIYVNSVTFSFGGNDYTFSEVLDQKWISQFDNGDASQTIPIVFGDDNMDFLFELEKYIEKETNGQYSYEKILSANNIIITLHGTEEVVATLPNTFLLEFMVFDKALIEDKSDIGFFEKVYDPTPLSIKINNEVKTNRISVPDIRLTTSLPATYAWVTETVGDYEILAQVYNKSIDQFKDFMKQQGNSIMACDPNSDIRISVASFPAAIDIKNYALQNDAELIEVAHSADEAFESSYGFTVTDIWVLRNDNLAFVCYMAKLPLIDQKQIICQTCVDGQFYQILIRGTNDDVLRNLAKEVVSSTEITAKGRENLHIDTGNIDLILPMRWEVDSQNITENAGTYSENLCFRVHADDGTSNIAVISITDLMTSMESDGSAEDRSVFDQVYTQMYFDLVWPQLSSHTQDVKLITLNDYSFALFSHPTFENTSYLFGIGYGYAFHVIYDEPVDGILENMRFSELKALVEEILLLYRSL